MAVNTDEFTIDYQKHNSLEHANRNAFSYNSLRIPSNSGSGEHAMRKDTWQGGKVGVRVNRVAVPRGL